MSLTFSNLSLPYHVGIIMDGNGRWAKKQNLPRIYGHKKGIETVRRIIIQSRELGIPYLTLFAFSKENWQRPQEEVEALLLLLEKYLEQELPLMLEKDIRFKVIGDKEEFSPSLQENITEVERLTSHCRSLTLTLALSYSGRAEILRAIRKIAEKVKAQEIQPEEIEETLLREFFYFPELPDPDLLIRTGGEIRISNFFLFQLAYTELYFTEVLWPDFTEENFLEALQAYQKRERRFGRIYEY